MTNSYDIAYDELPSCCCAGMEENEKLKEHLREYIRLRDAPHRQASAETQVDTGYIDAWEEWERKTEELLK